MTERYTLITGPNCPKCSVLKAHLYAQGVEVPTLSVEEPEAQALCAYYEVRELHVLVDAVEDKAYSGNIVAILAVLTCDL